MKTQNPQFFKTNISHIKDNLVNHIDKTLNAHINSPSDLIVPECFAINGMYDSRFAKALYTMFPILEANLNLYRNQGHKCYGTTQFIEIYNKHNKNFGKVIFANMICKRNNRSSRQLDYIALSRCLIDINAYIRKNYRDSTESKPIIACTKFGCGKSGGNWQFIEQILQDSLDNYKIEVYHNHDSVSNI